MELVCGTCLIYGVSVSDNSMAELSTPLNDPSIRREFQFIKKSQNTCNPRCC